MIHHSSRRSNSIYDNMFAFEIEISLIDKFEMIDGITANDVDFRSHHSRSLSLSVGRVRFLFFSPARDDFNI